MRSSWLCLLSFLLTLAVLPAYASVTYAPVTIDTVISNGQYVARPVVLDTAGFATTTGRVSTLGARAEFGVAVRASAQSASLILRTGGRLLGPLGLVAAGALTLYDLYKAQGLQECAAGSNTWCVKSYNNIPSGGACVPNIINGNLGCYWFGPYYGMNNCPPGAGAASNPEYWWGIKAPSWAKSSCIVWNPSGTLTPATDADFEKVAVPFPYAVIGDNWSKVVSNQNLPVDAWKTTTTPYSVWTGNPYVGSDGKYRRDGLIINPSNSVFPAQARVEGRTFGPFPTPEPLQTPTPFPGTPEDPNQPQLDLCAINPDIIACAQQEDYYSRMASKGVSSAAMTQEQFEESDKKFGDAIDAVGAGLPPDNTISSAEAAYDGVDNIIQNIDSANLPTLANIEPPSYSQCKTISFTFKDQPFVFPNADQCQKIEQLKTSFGYFLSGLVLLSLVWQLLTRPQG